MKALILTIQFLTRIPIPITIEVNDETFIKGVSFYPIVGFIIGGINGGIYLLASKIAEGFFPIICSVLSNILITGGLHVDGLADTCDGIYSARPREKMLEIMKDSRLGTNGALAICFDLLFRLSLLWILPQSIRIYMILVTPILAKTVVALLLRISAYARKSGLAGMYLGKMRTSPVAAAFIFGGFLSYWIIGLKGVLLILILCIGAILFEKYMQNKLGGMTGDTLGAANELFEIISLLCMVIFVKGG